MLPFLEGLTSPPSEQKVNKGLLQHVGGKAEDSQVSGGESDFGSQMGVQRELEPVSQSGPGFVQLPWGLRAVGEPQLLQPLLGLPPASSCTVHPLCSRIFPPPAP